MTEAIAATRAATVSPTAFWRLAGALLVFQGVLGATIGGLLDAADGWLALVGMSALVLGVAAVLRAVGVPRPLATFGGALALLLGLTAAFGSGTGLGGLVPTAETFARFSFLIEQSRVSIETQSTPAPPLPELVFLFAAAGGGLAVLADLLSVVLRWPALVAFLAVPVLLVPTILLPDGVSPVAIAVAAAGYALVLLADTATRRAGRPTGRALLIPGVAVVAALAIAVTAPGFSQFGQPTGGSGGFSVGTGVNPLIDLGSDLRRPFAVRALTYTTTAGEAPYLRMSSLDTFSGTTWRHTDSTGDRLVQGRTLSQATGVGAGVDTRGVTTSIQIDRMRSNWLPVPYPVTELSGLQGPWLVQDSDRTVSAPTTATANQSYVARSRVPAPTAAQLRQAGVPSSGFDRYLALPSDVPSIVTATTTRVTRAATTPYDRAVALQAFFHDGSFSYSEDTPAQDGFDGDSMAIVARFLDVRSGYCVHFASAMAIMAREAGIPSRIAIGYLPGTADGSRVGGRTQYEVTSDDLHAWPELYFEGIGWTAFEPTVGRGSEPDYTVQTSTAAPSESATAAPSSSAATPTPTTTSSGRASATSTGAGGPAGPLLGWLLAAALVVVLLLIPGGLRMRVRARRIARVRDGTAPPGTAWGEVVDTARDLGIPLTPSQTPREIAGRLGERHLPSDDAEARTALASVLATTELSSYGPPATPADGPRIADALAVVVERLIATSGAADRRRARFAPRSLLQELRAAVISRRRPATRA